MLTCVRCNLEIDTSDLSTVVAQETIGFGDRPLGLEWAHIECEAASIKTPAAYIDAELRDGDTFLTIAQMENALTSRAERTFELVQSR